jgi:DNA-binding GntR family transcriptional regulator
MVNSPISTSLPPLRPAIGAPLWLQLKHALRDLVTFNLKPGDRIPPEPELCRHYGLSRITVRQAITSLVDEGLLNKQQGRGTFVLAPRLAQQLVDADHFLSSGFDAEPREHVSLFSTESMPAPDWLARKLGIVAGDDVFKIRKVLALPGASPVAYRTTFLTAALVPNLLQVDLSPPMHAVLEKSYGLNLASADEIIEFIVADEFRASMLKTEVGHPLILVERILYLESGQAIDCSRAYYRADRFRFEHRLQRVASQPMRTNYVAEA